MIPFPSFNAIRICHSQIALPTLEHVRRELRKYQSVAKRQPSLLIPFAGIFEGPYDLVFLQERRFREVELPVFWHVYAHEHESALLGVYGHVETLIAHMMRQLLEGLAALHEAGLVHGAICPSAVYVAMEAGREEDSSTEQIVSGEISVALAEAGLGYLFRQRDDWAGRGVIEALHEAPERLMCNKELGANLLVDGGAKGDIWSMGCLFYQLLTGKQVGDFQSPRKRGSVTSDVLSIVSRTMIMKMYRDNVQIGFIHSACVSTISR